MTRFTCTLVLGLCVSLPALVGASEHKRKDRDVLIDNKKRLLTIYDSPAVPPNDAEAATSTIRGNEATLRSTQTIVIRPNEVVQVGIDRQNPLIFVYSWKGVVQTPTPDFNAVTAFAGSLTKLTGIAPFKTLTAAVARRTEKAPPAEASALKTRMSRVSEIAAAAGFTDGTVTEIVNLRASLISAAESMPELRRQTLDDNALDLAKKTVQSWEVAEQKKRTDRLFALLTNARNALLKALQDDPLLFDSDPGFVATLNMLSNEEANVRRILTTVTQFADGMSQVGTRLPLGEGIDFDVANNLTATVGIEYATGGQDLVKDAIKGQQPLLGDITITFEPYSSFMVGGGPSALYVFRKKADGSKNIGFRPVGMLTISRRSWQSELLVPHFEVGVTPETDAVGIYVGGGFRIRGAFHLSGGVTAQQQKVGDASDWHPSGYLGVTVDLVPKK